MGNPRPTDDPAVRNALYQAIMRLDHPLVTSISEIKAKSLLIKLKSDQNSFGILYNMNLYRGCAHGCIYCDTRSECYGIIDISRLEVKVNAIDLLRRELSRKRQKGMISTGSMNDPYMPLEKERRLTRQALEVCLEKGFPVHVITKSPLVLRDIDVLRQLAAIHAVVSFSITTVDDALARRLEPGAPPPSERLRAIATLRENGIHAGALMMPFLPGLTDGEESIKHLVKALQEHKAEYAMPGCLTLREAGRSYLYSRLALFAPEAMKLIQNIYGDRYLPPRYYAEKVYRMAADMVRQAGLLLEPIKWQRTDPVQKARTPSPVQQTLF